jgi:hypothetical protein
MEFPEAILDSVFSPLSLLQLILLQAHSGNQLVLENT